MNHLKFKNG